jgi:hypothetical protein
MVAPSEPVLKTKMEDMGSLRGPRKSKADSSKLNSLEIIQRSAQQEMGGKADVNQIVNGLAALIQKGAVQLLQIGNTVFTVMPKQQGTVEIHTFTVEEPQTLVKRYQSAAKSLKSMGFKRAVTYAESPAFVKIAQQTGLPVKISQGQQTISGQKRPTYQFVLDL